MNKPDRTGDAYNPTFRQYDRSTKFGYKLYYMIRNRQIAELEKMLDAVRLQIEFLEASAPEPVRDSEARKRIREAKSEELAILEKIAEVVR